MSRLPRRNRQNENARMMAETLTRPASVATPERILQRLDWQIIRKLDGILQGDYRSLFHGFGLDFADLREYQPGDDIRYIDWNVTARMNTPYVREYLEDREISAWFLLDVSPSVDFGTTQTFKRDVLIDFTTILARLLTRHGNRVGAILYDGKQHKIIPAHGGRIQVLRLVNDLFKMPHLPRAPFTDLAALLQIAFNTIRRRSLIFIVSDFISAPGWGKLLGLLSQRHEIIAIRIYDPRETELPDVGPLFLEDAETGEQLYIDTGDRNFRERFQAVNESREAELRAAFHHASVDELSLSTEDNLIHAVIRFAAMRKQRKRQLRRQ